MKRVCAAIGLCLALPASALADTTTVDPAASGACARGGTCKTINEAVTASSAGDTLVVKPGSYAETVALSKALTVNAEVGAIVAGRVNVTVADVKIDGLGVITETGADPALRSTAGNLTLTNSAVVSFSSTAVSLTAGAANVIKRSTIASAAGAGDGLALGAVGATVDSSIVLGGANAAAFRVTTAAGSANASLTLNHITTVAPGTGFAVVLDGSGGSLPLQTVGDIALKVAGSIVHGPNAVSSDPGVGVGGIGLPLPGVHGANAVTASFTNSDATEFKDAAGNTVAGTGNPTADNLLFSSSKLRLKPNAPVIGKGGSLADGESTTDIDGDPRTAPTDIGADEFQNHTPTLEFSVAPANPSTADKVVVTAKATDKDGPQDIAGYLTDWGDGSKRDQTSGNVVQHVYQDPGTYTITMGAADRTGANSNVVTHQVTVTDGTPPQLQITTPGDGGSVKHPKRKKLQLTIKGVFADPSGVKEILVALTRKGQGCLQYNGSKLVKRSCSKFTFLKAKLSGNGFRLVTKKSIDVIRGSYEIRAKGSDTKGNASSTFDHDTKSLISFKVK
jgi:PKD repeat protein